LISPRWDLKTNCRESVIYLLEWVKLTGTYANPTLYEWFLSHERMHG